MRRLLAVDNDRAVVRKWNPHVTHQPFADSVQPANYEAIAPIRCPANVR